MGDWDWDWDARRALGLLLPTVAGTTQCRCRFTTSNPTDRNEGREGKGKSRGREKRGQRGWDGGEEVVGQQRAGNVAGAELKGEETFRQACAVKRTDWLRPGLPPVSWGPCDNFAGLQQAFTLSPRLLAGTDEQPDYHRQKDGN